MEEDVAWIVYENVKLGIKTIAVMQMVPRGMWDLAMVLIG